MCLPVHLGKMGLFLITYVNVYDTCKMEITSCNIFRDRPINWEKIGKNCLVSNTSLQLPKHDEKPFGRLRGVLGAGSGRSCCLWLFTSDVLSMSALCWSSQLCSVITCLVDCRPVTFTGVRGWRCTSDSSELLQLWTVGGEEPKFLAGRKSKCLKTKIHL